MLREYLEKKVGFITEEEWREITDQVKEFIIKNLGGTANVELVKELLVHQIKAIKKGPARPQF